MKVTVRPVALAPVTTDSKVEHNGLVGVVFRNAGTATVHLWNGAYTLDPGETLAIGVQETGATMELSVDVKFDTVTGANKKLQIVLTRIASC